MSLIQRVEVGKLGEEIASKYLAEKGHIIIDRNYRLKYGEIDVVSKKDGIIYFSEVKTVIKGEGTGGTLRPEENVHEYKIKSLARAVQVYLVKKFPTQEPAWEFLIVAILLDPRSKTAEVNLIRDVLTS